MAKFTGKVVKGMLEGEGALKICARTLWDGGNVASGDYRYLPVDDVLEDGTSLMALFLAIRQGGNAFTKGKGLISHASGFNQALPIPFECVNGIVVVRGAYVTSEPEAGDYKRHHTTKAAIDQIVAEEAAAKEAKKRGGTRATGTIKRG